MEWNTIQRRIEKQNEKVRVRDGPALHEEIPWIESFRKKKKKKTSRHESPIKRVFVQKGMPVIMGIHLGVSFMNKEVQTWECSVL